MKKQSDKDMDRRIDNGLKRQELEKKYGAKFGGSSELPPDVESEWLNYIETFEEQFENAKQVTVYKKLGEPSFKAESELSDKELSSELERLYKIMADGFISLDVLSEVDDREIYRFITEELFQEEIDDMDLPGFRSCFIYEEFHPDAKLDIESAIDYFFRMTMAKMENIGGEGYDLLYIDTDDYLDTSGKSIPKTEIENRINTFLKAYDSFEILKEDITDIRINEEENDALAVMDVAYKAWLDQGKVSEDHQGKANFRLRPSEYGGWAIYSIDMPGWRV
ncbi:MAG: hypothetical protein R6V52_01210 [Bacteroidales bacterium]